MWREALRVRNPMLEASKILLTTYAVLKAETETCMRLLGAEKISDLGPKHVSLPFRSLTSGLNSRLD